MKFNFLQKKCTSRFWKLFFVYNTVFGGACKNMLHASSAADPPFSAFPSQKPKFSSDTVRDREIENLRAIEKVTTILLFPKDKTDQDSDMSKIKDTIVKEIGPPFLSLALEEEKKRMKEKLQFFMSIKDLFTKQLQELIEKKENWRAYETGKKEQESQPFIKVLEDDIKEKQEKVEALDQLLDTLEKKIEAFSIPKMFTKEKQLFKTHEEKILLQKLYSAVVKKIKLVNPVAEKKKSGKEGEDFTADDLLPLKSASTSSYSSTILKTGDKQLVEQAVE